MKNTIRIIAILLIANITINTYAQRVPREEKDFIATTKISNSGSSTATLEAYDANTQLVNVSRDQKGDVVSIFGLSAKNGDSKDVYGRDYTQIYKDILFADDMAKSAKEITAKYNKVTKDKWGNIIAFEVKDDNAELVNVTLDNHGFVLNIEGPDSDKNYNVLYQELLTADMMMQVANELNDINGKVYRDNSGNVLAFEVKFEENNKKNKINSDGINL